MADILVAFYAA